MNMQKKVKASNRQTLTEDAMSWIGTTSNPGDQQFDFHVDNEMYLLVTLPDEATYSFELNENRELIMVTSE